LSYGNSPRGSPGGKGSRAKKSVKKKKQEFHRSKIKLAEEKTVDISELKARTVAALNRMGEQKISPEPGGYGLENWINSVNALLDDFQEKVGAAGLPPEYYRKRREFTKEALESKSEADVESELEKLRLEIGTAREKERAHREMGRSSAAQTKAELEASRKELEELKARVDRETAEWKSASFFGRLVGRKKAPDAATMLRTGELERKVDELEARPRETGQPEGEGSELEELEERQSRLMAQREELLQLSETRAKAAMEFVVLISEVQEGQTKSA